MKDVVSFLIPSILLLFTNNFAKSLCASNLTQFFLLNVFFVQKSNRMVKKIGQNFFTIDRNKCISGDFRSSKFKIFLERSEVKYTVLLIPVYLEVGIIG